MKTGKSAKSGKGRRKMRKGVPIRVERVKGAILLFSVFLVHCVCYAQTTSPDITAPHPGGWGINWVEVICAGIFGGLFGLVVFGLKSWFTKGKAGKDQEEGGPEGKGGVTFRGGSSSYKQFLEESYSGKEKKMGKENEMGMVFCRGCGKKIHETAPTCPHCGAPQSLQSNTPHSRNVALLVIVALGWTLVFWFGFLFIGGFIVGMTHQDNAHDAGYTFGRELGGPLLLLALSSSALLTFFGLLPGTKKPKSS